MIRFCVLERNGDEEVVAYFMVLSQKLSYSSFILFYLLRIFNLPLLFISLILSLLLLYFSVFIIFFFSALTRTVVHSQSERGSIS